MGFFKSCKGKLLSVKSGDKVVLDDFNKASKSKSSEKKSKKKGPEVSYEM